MSESVLQLARPDIVALEPYQHAAWEPTLQRLHANELPWRAAGDNTLAGLNRYPEPQPRILVERLAELYGMKSEQVLVGRGSDEAIDLLVRAFCRAGEDGIAICPPTFGMYAVAARIQGASVVACPLRADQDFALDEQALLDCCTPSVKLVFLCSPNNPTGNLLDEAMLLRIAARLAGRALLIVDEAYMEFAKAESLACHLDAFPHLVILRTLSKAYGLAGARCGALLANAEVVSLLRKIIPPYALPQLTVEAVLKLLEPPQLAQMRSRVSTICAERARLTEALRGLPSVTRVFPSDANFVLVEFKDAADALTRAREASLLIRDVRKQPRLERALRITVGSPEQNNCLIEALR